MVAKLPHVDRTSVSNVKHPVNKQGSQSSIDGFFSAIFIIDEKHILKIKPNTNINIIPPLLPKLAYASPKGEILELLIPLGIKGVNRYILASPPVIGLPDQISRGIKG